MNEPRTPTPPHGTQAIGRAIAVLNLLAHTDREYSTVDLARALDLTPATANRIVRALVAEGLVARNPVTETLFLGTTTVLLGQAAQRGFGLDRAMPALERVAAETDESVNLAIREGHESVVILRVQSTLPLRFEQRTGARFPLYTTASGKAMLAFTDDAADYVDALPAQLEQLTPHTLRTRDALRKQLADTARRGYSIDREENVAGVRCVGAPVLDHASRAQAAVVIQVPTVRMSGRRQRELAALAIRAAGEVSQVVTIEHRTPR